MSLRTVTIPVFSGPNGDLLKALVSFVLVDAVGEPILGQIIATGMPVGGQVDAHVHLAEQSVLLMPNAEIDPTTEYAVEIVTPAVRQSFRTIVEAGAGALTLSDLQDSAV